MTYRLALLALALAAWLPATARAQDAFGEPKLAPATKRAKELQDLAEEQIRAKKNDDAIKAAWTSFCRSLFAAAEFRYLN